ncbi:MAG TPA: D-sedoheptulose 7-phosphate isomerase [Candidatus Krumholzibacteria bacterium]|nr:D-sedoheptulose 7-phosphate isomerase [Candidatus Krumholzibacteria bacterium]
MSHPDRSARAAELFTAAVTDLRAVLDRLDDTHRDAVLALAADIETAWRAGGRFLACGNGGSASDAQHIVAELVGRFLAERPGYAALALTTNTSVLTAVGNDYGYDHVFARQVQALGRPGDVLLVISTSGNSANCLEAVKAARAAGLKVHGFLGGDGGRLRPLVDGALVVPSRATPKIQEIHITMGHLLCMVLEEWMKDDA